MNSYRNKIWFVEDDQLYTLFIDKALFERSLWDPVTFTNGKDLLEALKNDSPKVIILDYNLPDMDGLSILKHIQSHDDQIKVIMLSSQTDVLVAVETFKYGAFDYLVKSKDTVDILENSIGRALASFEKDNEIVSLKVQVSKVKIIAGIFIALTILLITLIMLNK